MLKGEIVMKLQDKVCIITGASSGMGRSIALLYAKEGAKVIAFARRKERLEEIAKEAEDYVGSILPYPGDLTKDEDIKGVVRTALETYGKIDVLVNNAGVMDNMIPPHEITDDHWDWIINVNLTSLMKLTREALNPMLEKENGVIINVASIGGLMGCRAGGAYAASKFGVVGYTKNVGFMYAKKGIRCNAICPGAVATEIGEAGVNNPSAFGMERAAAGMGANPRMGTPEEIASIALFLASDDSSFVNATTITADAGWTAY